MENHNFLEFCSMPLLPIKEAGPHAKIGLWLLTESTEELIKRKTIPAEDLLVLRSFSHDQRKKEWLAARILAEELTDGKNVRIVYDEHNKPALKGSQKHISISHSHSLLTMILDSKETGIDIELVKPNVERIKEKFLSEGELKSLGEEKLTEKLTLYWCAKEALYKYYGKKLLTFKEHLIVEPFDYTGTGQLLARIIHPSMNKLFKLHYEKISVKDEDYILAYILNEV